MQDRKKDTDVYNGLLDSEGEGEGGMIWENGILTCILSCKNQITSLCLTQDTACLGLVHGDDPEIEPRFLALPGGFFTTSATWEVQLSSKSGKQK